MKDSEGRGHDRGAPADRRENGRLRGRRRAEGRLRADTEAVEVHVLLAPPGRAAPRHPVQ